MNSENEKHILIMDDDVDFANFVYDVAKSLNLDCIVCNNSDEFMNAYNDAITLIFMDLNIPNIDGIELLRYVESKKFETDVILMSGVDKRVLESAQEFAISKGLSVIGYIQKPVRLNVLDEILKKSTVPKVKKSEVKAAPKKNEFIVTKEELNRAVENNEFVVFYQPKVEIATEKLLGVEALVRWQHPEQGLIFPDQFIGAAESLGFIDKMTWLIIKYAMNEINIIEKQLGYNLMLSINLSPSSLLDVKFPDKILGFISQSSVKPQNIIFEITETGLLNELSTALDILTRLRLKGIHLSIDDFGTGYAMMQQLKLIPATEIKIDKSFVQNMLISDSARVTVQKTIEIGHELGMKVIAEGVESKDHLLALRMMGCDVAQGYYYSKPIAINDFIKWINERQK